MLRNHYIREESYGPPGGGDQYSPDTTSHYFSRQGIIERMMDISLPESSYASLRSQAYE